MTTTRKLRQLFIDFYKKRKHKEIPSASLVPQNDPTTLFTGSGMQPLVPNLLGEPHPMGKRLVNSQKCFRAQDIDEVGDNRHTTFFEMLGNWSLGDYFKEKQLTWLFTFLTESLGLTPEKLYVTVFEGGNGVPKDEESVKIWQKLFEKVGIKAQEDERIFAYGFDKNWWSRTGAPDTMPAGEPGGPDSEVFYDFGIPHDSKFGKICHPNCDCGRFLEIGNSVFMQYFKKENGNLSELDKKNVDFGGGLERLVAAVNNEPDIFTIDVFKPIIKVIEKGSKKQYGRQLNETQAMRIIADHIRGAVLIITDGVRPGSKQQGAILRSLISKIIYNATTVLGMKEQFIEKAASEVVNQYSDFYPEVFENKSTILSILNEEEQRFRKKIKHGISMVKKILDKNPKDLLKTNLDRYGIDFEDFENNFGSFSSLSSISAGAVAFTGQTSYGLPPEYTKQLLAHLIKDEKEFKKSLNYFSKLHKNLSRKTSRGMFRGGLTDHSKQVIKLHTATHLLHQALRNILGNHVEQKGSHITKKRLRFDFSHPEKLSDKEIKEIEKEVNQKIEENLSVHFKETSFNEAINKGALAFFGERYGEKVKVYFIGNYSKEVCGGPHVDSTKSLGKFKIVKEKAAGTGVRRIYAILE